ncbi:MAG: DUF1330 domain-containing protein [Pseudomonadota bacterium]|nr:DUF1330 domain-containing protein [Pseudomonadota bacterium]
MQSHTYEGGAHQRCVLVGFESVDRAAAAYSSPAYQVALAKLEGAVKREVRIVPGVD